MPLVELNRQMTVAFTTAGLAASYGPDLPAGATTIALAGLVYLLVVSLRWAHGRWARAAQRPGASSR